MATSTSRQSLVRSTEEGERRWFFGGGVHIWKATAEETDGAFLLFEDRMGPGKVTPLHIHPDSDETMIILEGEILMHLDGVEHTVTAGGIAERHTASRTPSRSSALTALGCCASTLRAAAKPSTGMPANRSQPMTAEGPTKALST